MILYFDCYITDIPLGKPKVPKDDFRSRVKIYTLPTRLAISKYSLSSYSVYPWSNVLIKYQLDDKQEAEEFESYTKKLFPNAIIINNRSATQTEYKKSLEILNKMEDKWVFYAPNNDHPLLLPNEEFIHLFNRLIAKAEKWYLKYKNVAIPYTHFTEYLNVARPESLNFDHFCKGTKILEEDQDAIVALEPNGEFNSTVVVSKDLMNLWFNSTDLGDKRVIRAEDVAGKVNIKDEVLVIPKTQLGAHFESYEHTLGGMLEIRVDQIPSLFIPTGFFEDNIKVAYGYDKYREGWVNINPSSKLYSFQDPINGTDLKIGFEDIPLFWKSKIKEIDINKNANKQALEKGRKRNIEIMNYPWSLKNQGINLKTFRFWFKRIFLPLYPILNKLQLLPLINKVRKTLGFY